MSLPPELTHPALALVGVVGLGDKENPDRALYDTIFNKKQARQVPIQFIQLSPSFSFPPKKIKIKEKEKDKEKEKEKDINPTGILKANWLSKHFLKVPAVVVSFHHFDPFEPDWRNKDGNMINDLLEKKKSLQERGIKLVLVLITEQAKSKEDAKATALERINIIKNSLNVEKNCLYFFQPSGEAGEFIRIIEKSLYDQASSYYRDQAKKVKQQIDKLNRPQHLTLISRYYFKVAAYAELRQDYKNAIKYYTECYQALLDMLYTFDDMKLYEIKCVAEYVNCKICRLSMLTSIDEAAKQFTLHSKTFQSQKGKLEIVEFEHWAYISRQYKTFGEMLENSLKQGHTRPPEQPHPGFYYLHAATYTQRRKLKIGPRYKPGENENENDSGVTLYVGQLPINLSHPLEEIDVDAMLRSDEDEFRFTNYLRKKESTVDHSSISIELFTKAYEHFKKYKNLRMTYYCASMIAKEYLECENHDMALKFYERICKNYRKEKWDVILGDILKHSYDCSVKVMAFDSAISNGIELLSNSFQNVPLKDREEIQNNLFYLIQGRQRNSVLTLDMDQIYSFVECKPQFQYTTSSVGKEIVFRLAIRTDCPLPIRFSSLRVFFNGSNFNHVVINSSSDPIEENYLNTITPLHDSNKIDGVYHHQTDLGFWPGSIRVFEFILKTQKSRDLKCALVSLTIEKDEKIVDLQFKIGDRPLLDRNIEFKPIDEVKIISQKMTDIMENPYIRVTPRQLKVGLKISKFDSAFLDEWFPVKIEIVNDEKIPIIGKCEVELRSGETKECKAQFARDQKDLPGKQKLQDIEIGRIEGESSVSIVIYVMGQKGPGERVFKIKFSYHEAIDRQSEEECVVEKDERISFTKPFILSSQTARYFIGTQSTSQKHIGTDLVNFNQGEIIPLSISLRSLCPPALVKSLSLEFEPSKDGSSLEVISESVGNKLSDNWIWKSDENHKVHFLLKSQVSMLRNTIKLPSAYIKIVWKRLDYNFPEGGDFLSTTKINVPVSEEKTGNIEVICDVPLSVNLGSSFLLSYWIQNNSSSLKEITINVESSEYFLFSGAKSSSMKLLPFSGHVLRYQCLATQTGKAILPVIEVKEKKEGSNPQTFSVWTFVTSQE